MEAGLYKDETYKLIGLAMLVHRELGKGFLEPVYQEAFEILLKREHIPYEREKLLPIYFFGERLKKEYYADFVCYGKIILEFKAVDKIAPVHIAQVWNYLKASHLQIGEIFNFGEASFQSKRIILSDDKNYPQIVDGGLETSVTAK